MGARERNAARTREAILDAAIGLFLEHGFEATKIEDVAAAADVGISTLYRYFPSKEDLLIEPLSFRGHLSSTLRERPAEEPLGVALGHAVRVLLTAPRAGAARIRQISEIVERTPGPRARLLDDFVQERTLLEHAVAERLGRPVDDVFSVVTARLATVVLELIAQTLSAEDVTDLEDTDEAARRLRETTDRIMGLLREAPPVLPE